MRNIIKCNRCGGYISAEFLNSHNCVISLKEISTTFQYELVNDKNEPTIIANGWDGTLYRFVKTQIKSKVRSYSCKHLKGIVEIPIIYYSKNESEAIIVKGWDGILYRLIVSKEKIFNQVSDEFLQGKQSDKDYTEPLTRYLYIPRRQSLTYY